jgi:hypothetical protein
MRDTNTRETAATQEEDQPEDNHRPSEARLAAVVEAAYILDAIRKGLSR